MSMKSSITESLGQSLDACTLHVYLKDPTFVEYLNSFLLLPAFSNRIYYNQDTGYFELVHHDSMMGCMDGELTSSSSLSTLYLRSDSLGPPLDMKQSWDWLIEHRLPLFLRSDIYSEYKICKLLTTSALNTSNLAWRAIPFAQGRSSLPLSCRRTHELEGPTEQHNQRQQQRDEFNLPEINFVNSDDLSSAADLSTSEQDPFAKHLDILTSSKSDAQLDPQPHGRSERRVRLSMDPEVLTLSGGSPQRRKRLGAFRSSESVPSAMGSCIGSVSRGMNVEDVYFLSTKSGMSALWKFLKGKAGEKNWLFWLDAERVKYYKGIDQQRMIRDFRECYFHDSGSPLELPAEIRQKVSKTTRLTPELIQELQDAMITGLIEYWCPRFLLHHYHERDTSLNTSATPQLPTVFRSYSLTLQGASDYRQCGGYSHFMTTPQISSRTPTFKRVDITPSSLPKSSLPVYTKTNEDVMASTNKSHRHQSMNPSVTPIGPSNEMLSRGSDDLRASSGVWGKGSGGLQNHEDMYHVPMCSNTEDAPSVKRTPPSTSSSVARYSQLAKYSARHLPDPSSRCASRMEGSDPGSICRSHCTILSISGTPMRTPDHHHSQASDIANANFEVLFNCLAVEYRKAGGYFMNFLEKQESKVYINSLLFWREVQEYKALFVGKTFRPCAVERKSKTLFGRYISEGCTNSIECSVEIVNIISFKLWPAYEDLLDLAEEHAVDMLLTQWNQLCSLENNTFQQLDTAILSSATSTPSKSKHTPSDESGLEDLEEKVSMHADPSFRASAFRLSPTPRCRSSSASAGISRQPHNITSLNDIVNDPAELEFFKVYLNENFAAQDLMCWMDIENFRGIPASDRATRNVKAKNIRKNHLNRRYYFGPNSPASKEAQRQMMHAGGCRYGSGTSPRPSTAVLREVQKHVRTRLVKVWLAKFMLSPEFMVRNRGSRSSNCWDKSSTSFKQAIYEHSFIHSHEALLFRKFLTKNSCVNFQKYLNVKALKGHSNSLVLRPKENIEFWCEVQKYKGMCHAHTRESTLRSKARAIKDCFFCSPSPPELQIDIPMYIVEQISKKSHGPYLFREAQAVVFTNLYKGWKEYKLFLTGLNNRDFHRALERLKIDAQKHTRDQESYNRLEEERRKMWIPRFETANEKEQRVRNERERAEFGPIAVEFRLSTPDPSNYTYFTDLPMKYYTTEDAEEDKTEPSLSSSTTEIPAPSDNEPLVVMKMRGNKAIPRHIKQRIIAAKELSEISESQCHLSCASDEQVSELKGESTNQLHGTAAGSVAGSDDRNPRKSNQKGGRKKKTSIDINTISMKMSFNNREAYAYGSGLPEEEASYLEVTSNCEH